MTTEQVLFSTAVESLYRQALKGRLSEVLKLRLRHAGLDLNRPLLPAYPRKVWVRSLELTAEELYPGLEREEAMERLGQRPAQRVLARRGAGARAPPAARARPPCAGPRAARPP